MTTRRPDKTAAPPNARGSVRLQQAADVRGLLRRHWWTDDPPEPVARGRRRSRPRTGKARSRSRVKRARRPRETRRSLRRRRRARELPETWRRCSTRSEDSASRPCARNGLEGAGDRRADRRGSARSWPKRSPRRPHAKAAGTAAGGPSSRKKTTCWTRCSAPRRWDGAAARARTPAGPELEPPAVAPEPPPRSLGHSRGRRRRPARRPHADGRADTASRRPSPPSPIRTSTRSPTSRSRCARPPQTSAAPPRESRSRPSGRRAGRPQVHGGGAAQKPWSRPGAGPRPRRAGRRRVSRARKSRHHPGPAHRRRPEPASAEGADHRRAGGDGALAAPSSGGQGYGPYQLLESPSGAARPRSSRPSAAGVEGFEKVVAVKRILPHLSDNKEFVDMFIDEAKMVAGLTHPNIVQIFDLGKHRQELLHRDGVRARARPAHDPPPGQGARARAARSTSAALVVSTGLLGPRVRAPQEGRPRPADADRPPRHQPAEHPDLVRGRREAHGLRHRQGREQGHRHRRGRAARQAPLHEPGAGLGQADGPPLRRLLARASCSTRCSPTRSRSWAPPRSSILETVRECRVPPPSSVNPRHPASSSRRW